MEERKEDLAQSSSTQTVVWIEVASLAVQIGRARRVWRCHKVWYNLKTTEYFDFVRQRRDRAIIREEWIARVVEHAEYTEVQQDGRIRKWAWVPEAGKYLRVILLEDGETVHNAFFDRSYKGESI